MGTAGDPSFVQKCLAAKAAASMNIGGFQQMAMPCRPPNLQVNRVPVPRGYCDRCIMTGIQLMAAKGLDPDVFASSMGVRLSDLAMKWPHWDWRWR